MDLTSETAWEGCHSFQDWYLTPEGGAIHCGERMAVIADVHLGYEWARGLAGDCVPAHSLSETLGLLESMLMRGPIESLVVAGDLVESPKRCFRTAADVARLIHWLDARHVRLVLLEGNHDRSADWMARRTSTKPGARAGRVSLAHSLTVGEWTIAHGHQTVSARRLMMGHTHPVLKAFGRVAPCFLVGQERIVLPAFSRNAAGLDVATAIHHAGWGPLRLRCLASTGKEILDFGPLSGLSRRLT
jgi:putative SbcD/Mre11-related phosphoesterase